MKKLSVLCCLILCGCSIFDNGIMGIKPTKADVKREREAQTSEKLSFSASGNTTTPPIQPGKKAEPQTISALGQQLATFPPDSKVKWEIGKQSKSSEGIAESLVGSMSLNKAATILLWVGIVITIGSIFAIFMVPAGFGKSVGGLGLLGGIGFIAGGVTAEQNPSVFAWVLIAFIAMAGYTTYKIIGISKTASETPKIVDSIDYALSELSKIKENVTSSSAVQFIKDKLKEAQNQSTKDEVDKCQGKL